jgi:hypothetical protein
MFSWLFPNTKEQEKCTLAWDKIRSIQAQKDECDRLISEEVAKNKAAKRKARVEEQQALLLKFKEEDELARIAAMNSTPTIPISKHPVGDFLEYDGTSLPIKFIESIVITYVGREPELLVDDWAYDDIAYAAPAQPAIITITMTSGQKHELRCNRHAVLFVHEAIKQAWY